MRRNIAYAFRMLAKNPGFTIVAMLTLGLGIGANTTIFSLINSLLLRPLPYKNPDALVALDLVNGQSLFPWSYPMFEELRHDQRTFANVAGFSDLDVNLTGIEAPQRLRCELVSASYFAMLGIEPERGRVFRPEEDREPDAHPLALVNDKLWRQNFGGDVGLIGRTIHLNELPYRVVGVMPRGFNGQSGDIDVWVPLTMAPSLSHIPKRLVNARNFWMRTLARLKPGIAVAQARAQLLILAGEIEKAYPHPEAMSPWKVQATSLVEAKTDPVMRKSLLIMFGAVGFVLLIACVNMANLMMGRAMSRRKEIAVRLAIGASRGALIRQLLTESVILGVAGGIAGFFVAAYAIDLTVALHPEASVGFWAGFARSLESEAVRMDTPVVVFNLAISILAGALFGLLPAFESTRLDLNQALKDVTSGWSAGLQSLRRVHSRSVLIAGEMALALVLLAGAGLMLESFARMLQTNIGAAADHVLTASVDLPPRKYSPAAVVRFDEQLLNRLRAAPGVEAVSVANSLPVRGETDVTMMNLGPGKEEPAVGVHSVSPDYPPHFPHSLAQRAMD